MGKKIPSICQNLQKKINAAQIFIAMLFIWINTFIISGCAATQKAPNALEVPPIHSQPQSGKEDKKSNKPALDQNQREQLEAILEKN